MKIQFKRISHRLLFAVGSVVIFGVVGIVGNYAMRQEEVARQEAEAALDKTTESVERGLSALMEARHAKAAPDFAERLKTVPNVVDYRVLRADGTEAFIDNLTVDRVNERLGDMEFTGRPDAPAAEQVLADTDPDLQRVRSSGERVFVYRTLPGGERQMTSLVPILARNVCTSCHGTGEKIRGILKLTVSLKEMDDDIEKTWWNSIIIIVIALFGIIALIYWAAHRTIVSKIVAFSKAMEAAGKGDLSGRLPGSGGDELGNMARSFNQMNEDLLEIYSGLKGERRKLNTIINGANSGIVVTDANMNVVLVNEAAESLLGKTEAQVVEAGFLQLFDDPEWMQARLAAQDEARSAVFLEWREKVLNIQASTIRNESGEVIGSAALIRDVTDEKRLEARLREQSVTDALTGLGNRRFFDEKLSAEFKRWRRYGQPLSLMMIDIDHFKKFNDTHGHDCGDNVLRAIGGVLKSAEDAAVIPCRYGGEEMVILMEGYVQEKAAELADRIRQQIAALIIDGLQVTASIGVAGCPGHPVDSGEALLKLADEALYRAKESGRNRVCQAEPV
jgi:diguanylate cyclase (GGDEF)-like protein/PAS domain S-box-containing protein